MRKLFGRVKYRVINEGLTAEIYAPLKSTGKLALLGFVNSSAIAFMRSKAEFEKHSHIIRLKQ